jgi:hypothetical protein
MAAVARHPRRRRAARDAEELGGLFALHFSEQSALGGLVLLGRYETFFEEE